MALDQPGPPTSDQTRFWNEWNATYRERPDQPINKMSRREADFVLAHLRKLQLARPNILEVGCGSGWFCEELASFGPTTGIDLADEVAARARSRAPHVNFIAGDFMTMELPAQRFDLVVTLETLSHVADQRLFMQRAGSLLKPGGYFAIVTQNRPIFQRMNTAPPGPGQIRRWVDRRELEQLIRPHFTILDSTTLRPADGHEGILRFINSHKLNAVLSRLTSPARVESLKERAGFGRQLAVFARKPQ